MTAIPNDETLPGFQSAFDMEQMRTELEDAMPRLAKVHSCRIDRFRYRKGARATFAFEAITDSGAVWITGTLWPGLKAWNLFQKNEGTGYSSRTHMLLERFPEDRKMPDIARVLKGNCTELLTALRQRHGSTVKIKSYQTVRYRPHIACVILLTISAPDTAEDCKYYLKIYAEDDAATFSKNLERVADGENYALLRPAYIIPGLNAVLWPEITGTSLAQAIAGDSFSESLETAARGLRAFHTSSHDLPNLPAASLVQSDANKHTTFIRHFLPTFSSHLAELCEALPKQFDDALLSPIHHDMKPEHLLVRNDCCHIIDVEGLALGDPAIDIGNMVARIHALSWLNGVDPNQCKSVAAVFVESSSRIDPKRLSAAVALGKLKLATFAVSHQIENWETIARGEVETALRLAGHSEYDAQRTAA
jgi:hypothetical protein